MSESLDVIKQLNQDVPQFIKLLGGRVTAVDYDNLVCTFEFNIGREYCHSIDVVQGGFVTAMLDAAISHAIFAVDPTVVGVSSLEIKTSFLEATRAGKLTVTGKVIKAAYKTAFFEGHITNSDGLLTATASSVAKLVRNRQ
jgi:uncharacterized protein (TIGR00369 family)